MKKRLSALIAAAMLLAFTVLPACAQGQYPRLIDQAGLLTSSEQESVAALLDDISEEYQCDVAVITVDGLGGYDVQAAADAYYEQLGYGYGDDHDGMMLMISMADRDWYITTEGFGITAVNDDALNYIEGEMLSDLSSGNYASAFKSYANACEKVIKTARKGKPYKTPFNFASHGVLAAIIGSVVGFIRTRILKGQLKDVHTRNEATEYMKRDSMELTGRNDLYLYSTVARTPRPKQNTARTGGGGTHMSAGGHTHGGGGGKF